MKNKLFAIFILIVFLTANVSPAQAVVSGQSPNKKIHTVDSRIPGQYIVTFKKKSSNTDKETSRVENSYGFKSMHKYRKAINGFSVKLTDKQLKRLQNDPNVQSITQDEIMIPDALSIKEFQPDIVSGDPTTTQLIDSSLYRIGAVNNIHKGDGIGIALFDSGVDISHPDLIGSVSPVGVSCGTNESFDVDLSGHGTLMAGLLAAKDNNIGIVGVAPNSTIFSVKINGSNGLITKSAVICGIDWVIANASTYNIRVASMSFHGHDNPDSNCDPSNNQNYPINISAYHQAFCNLANAGVVTVVAAGNVHSNTGKDYVDSFGGYYPIVPANFNDAVITVSALADSDGLPGGLGAASCRGTSDDQPADYTAYGSAVDIMSPGDCVLTTNMTGGYSTISGTSPATPFVAGAVALLLQANPTAKIGQTLTNIRYKTPPVDTTFMRVRNLLVKMGEPMNQGHTDPAGLHTEPVLNISTL